MTTAFAHAAGGQVPAAIATQPMGALLAVLLATGFWAGLHAAWSANRVLTLCSRLLNGRLVAAGLVLTLAAWLYKILIWNG